MGTPRRESQISASHLCNLMGSAYTSTFHIKSEVAPRRNGTARPRVAEEGHGLHS